MVQPPAFRGTQAGECSNCGLVWHIEEIEEYQAKAEAERLAKLQADLKDWVLEGLYTSWTHPDIEGWLVTANGRGTYTMTTPEGATVMDRFGDPWRFQSRQDAYQFAVRAMAPEGV